MIDDAARWRGGCINSAHGREELWAMGPVERQGHLWHLPWCLCTDGKCRGSAFVPNHISDGQLAALQQEADKRVAAYLAERRGDG